MTKWNFDLTSIPRGRTETKTRTIKVKGNPVEQKYEVFTPEPVWVETHNGEVVRSHFCQPTKQSPNGWWSGVGDESRIKCWQPFVRPAPSGKRYDVSAEFLPVIEDVGSV